MTATRLTLAVAALAAGTFLLTACEPVNSSSGSGSGTTCDPNGWGPLSGCGTADTGSSPELEPTTPVPAADQEPTRTSEKAGTREHNVTVTVTWIVVHIDVTGLRECVISLREAPPSLNDHFSRRITTPEDCEAQRVDTVYRPVDE